MALPDLEAERRAREAALAPNDAPSYANTTYGRGEVKIVQANVSDLKAIKGALLDPQPKPDHEGVLGAIGAAGLVAFKILYDGTKWRLPASTYEAVVLLFVFLHAYASARRYAKAFMPRTLTQLALAHVNDMISQVEKVDDGRPVAKWWRFMSPKKS